MVAPDPYSSCGGPVSPYKDMAATMFMWTPEDLSGVVLPEGATAEDVAAKANELFRLREVHILALSRSFPKRAASMPSFEEFSKALLEHIEDYKFYMDRQNPGFLDDIRQCEAAFRDDDVRTSYGLPVNKHDIAEYLNWQTKQFLPCFDSVMDATIAVKTSFDENDSLLEMPWCPCPGEPVRPI